ncbi:hypothetical protein KKI23_01440, partial [Patescibacteria group bacterium]|nr:hypothetical protein [Patescibacteria group bacterium]
MSQSTKRTIKQKLIKTTNLIVNITLVVYMTSASFLVAAPAGQAETDTFSLDLPGETVDQFSLELPNVDVDNEWNSRGVTVNWPTEWDTTSCNWDPAGDESPSEIDLYGEESALPAVFYKWTDEYVFFRERVTGNPSGPGGFAQQSWVVLIQGDGDYYDYMATLNGSPNGPSDQVQLWKNWSGFASINWDPIMNDPAEMIVGHGDASIYARPPLADGLGNYFVDWAVPTLALTIFGVDQDDTFWFATSANANNFNKDHLDCYEAPDPICGDGIVQPEIGEECDGDAPQACTTGNGYSGTQICLMPNNDRPPVQYCTWGNCETTENCGDGIMNGTEECDGDDGVSGGQVCSNE